jgi:DNA topoisomerase-1
VLHDIKTSSVIQLSPPKSARRASLAYTSDEGPGIRRIGNKDRFVYLSPKGRELRNRQTLDRIHALAIPPAWTDVWISPDPDGHLQATGRDQRGRKQYRYHPRWSACRDEVKYSSLLSFFKALPALRLRIDVDLRRRNLSRERVVASIVWLLENTMIHVGNAAYARDNKSFGLTTLRDRHVEIQGSTLRFAFTGKSGKHWRLKLTDRRIARVVRGAQELPGQHLFQYLDSDGNRQALSSQDVNDYIRETMGEDFSSKHFRTWAGTVRAASLLAAENPAETKSAGRRTFNQVIDKVARVLGNTRAVCRNCYVHPRVIEGWTSRTIGEEMQAARRSLRKSIDGLDEEESIVFRWLAKDETQPG